MPVWSEKYRPKKFEDVIGDTSQIRELVKDPMSMPNFLFVSKSPGTGKRSLARVICYEIGLPWSDLLVMNSSDERKIETIRTTVKEFAITKRRKENIPKIIIMDEFDGMLATSQDALRFLMEEYNSNCKFILTANEATKIIDPIKSRCKVFTMSDIEHEDIIKRLIKMCNDEGFAPGNDAMLEIVNYHYPDMRAMINHIQSLAPDVTIDRVKPPTGEMEKYYQLIKTRSRKEARQFFITNALNPEDTLKYCFNKMESEGFMTAELAYYTAEKAFAMKWGAWPEMQMYAWAIKTEPVFGGAVV